MMNNSYFLQKNSHNMRSNILLSVLYIHSMVCSDSLKGFEYLDNFSEDLVAGDNVVKAETSFSLQFSICLWVNPSWIRRGK